MGFTLVEFVVVFAVVLILVAFLFPAVKRGIDGARSATCLGHMRSVGVAATTYAGEHKGFLPATFNFREFDSEGSSTDTMHSWSAAMDPYLAIPLGGADRFKRSPYRCPGNPIGGINYALVHGVSRFSTYQWEPRKNLSTLANASKVPYLIDGPPSAGQILGRPTRSTDSSMGYVVLTPGAMGGTAIRSRTGPDNPNNPSSGNYWIPPHAGGNSLNILYVDGSVRAVAVPFFTDDDLEHGFYSENTIPPGNPNPNL